MLKIRYSHDIGALYLKLREGNVDNTVNLSDEEDELWADVDADGNVIGVEILFSDTDIELDVPERITTSEAAHR